MKDVKFKDSLWSLNPEGLNNAEECIQGHAEFHAGWGVSVHTPLGKLLNRKPNAKGIVVHSVDDALHADAIWGVSQDGYFQTVLDVRDVGSGFSALGFEYQTLRGREMYSSKLGQPVEVNPLISKFSFKMDGLREWVGASPFEEVFRLSKNRSNIDEYRLSFSSENTPDVVIYNQNGTTIKVDHIWTSEGGPFHPRHFEFNHVSDYMVVFKFENQINLDSALRKWIFPTREFLSFCMGFRGEVHDMRFTISSGTAIDYLAPISLGSDVSNNDLTSMPFSWKRNASVIPSMFERWLAFDDQAEVAARRAVSLLRPNPIPPIEALFSSVANAFEAITRIGANPYSLSPEKHRDRIDSIVAKIEDEGLKGWVKQKLSFSNLKSANELAKEQLNRLGPVADYLIPNRAHYLKDHRDTRNYYSHLDPRKKSHILKPGRELVVNTEATHLLLYCSICLLLGLSAEDILTMIKKTRFKEASIFRIRKQYHLDD